MPTEDLSLKFDTASFISEYNSKLTWALLILRRCIFEAWDLGLIWTRWWQIITENLHGVNLSQATSWSEAVNCQDGCEQLSSFSIINRFEVNVSFLIISPSRINMRGLFLDSLITRIWRRQNQNVYILIQEGQGAPKGHNRLFLKPGWTAYPQASWNFGWKSILTFFGPNCCFDVLTETAWSHGSWVICLWMANLFFILQTTVLA